MYNRININYSLTKDYSALNQPSFVNILKIYNLVLLPITNDTVYNLSVSDEITFFDKINNTKFTQKIVISTGHITIYGLKYFYFYIGNGIPVSNNEYSILLDDSKIDLSTRLSPIHSAKLLIGSLILDDDYQYLFDKDIPILLNINKQYYKTNMVDLINKYNYYAAFKNNSILLILDNNNIDILQAINNHYLVDFSIRPLFFRDFPLGSIMLSISYSNGVLINDPLEFKILLNNKSIFLRGNTINIINLVSGQYAIKIVDRSGLLYIDHLNGQPIDKDNFSFEIQSVSDNYQLNNIALPLPRQYKQPLNGLSNLMINLNYDKSITILGPNNINYKYDNGYQSILNTIPGEYTIIQDNKSKSFILYPNHNTIVSTL